MQNTDERLDGWKSIARYVGQDWSIAIRETNERRHSVHLLPGGNSRTVDAIRGEIDAWMRGEAAVLPLVDHPIAGSASRQPRSSCFLPQQRRSLPIPLISVCQPTIRRCRPGSKPGCSMRAAKSRRERQHDYRIAAADRKHSPIIGTRIFSPITGRLRQRFGKLPLRAGSAPAPRIS